MSARIDVKGRRAVLTLSKGVYGREALEIAARVLAGRADALLSSSAKAFTLTLQAKRRDAGRPELEALAGEFANELFNQEYRFLVGRFNRKISSLIVTQALLSARGGENPPAPPAEESSPGFQAKVAELMRAAQEEIDRTMPRKIAPQGAPLPPHQEDGHG